MFYDYYGVNRDERMLLNQLFRESEKRDSGGPYSQRIPQDTTEEVVKGNVPPRLVRDLTRWTII